MNHKELPARTAIAAIRKNGAKGISLVLNIVSAVLLLFVGANSSALKK